MIYYSNTTSTTNGKWWLSSPYYMRYQSSWFYPSSKVRTLPEEEIQQMTDEEFSSALNDLLFSDKQEEPNG